MARFTVSLSVPAPADVVWARLTAWREHGRWVPFTQVRDLPPAAGSSASDGMTGVGIGARFVARTGVGSLGFDDVMEVTQWAPPTADLPGRCRLVKQGRLVGGGAEIEVHPGSAGDCQVRWTEELLPAPQPLLRVVDPVLARVGRRGLRRVLTAMTEDLADRSG